MRLFIKTDFLWANIQMTVPGKAQVFYLLDDFLTWVSLSVFHYGVCVSTGKTKVMIVFTV